MSEIPDDVRAAAYELLTKLSDDREPDTQGDVALLVAALLAEREAATARERARCARLAEALPSRYGHLLPRKEIAAAIRSPDKDRGEEDNAPHSA